MHEVLTSDTDWDPTCLGSPGNFDNKTWCDAQSSMHKDPSNTTFNDPRELKVLTIKARLILMHSTMILMKTSTT